MRRMIWTILPLLAILSVGPLAAAQSFENTGVVDDVQVKQGAIVVDDTWYLLAPGFLVHGSPDGKLEKKMKIAFTTRNTDAGSKMITEVWVLPANFVFPEDN
ncbi:MAG: PilY2 family type 4a fimbrial biogenesis protein [Acidiferrobacterales bacterium]